MLISFLKNKWKKQEPVVIYQMGKVGSTSLYNSIRSIGVKVFHFHKLYPPRVEKEFVSLNKVGAKIPAWVRDSDFIFKNYISKGLPLKVITPVREPVSRNISAFFQNADKFVGTSAILSATVEEIRNIFVSKYPHDLPDRWFREDFNPALNVDIFSHSFPYDTGYLQLNVGNTDILIFKTELPDVQKTNLVREFIQQPDFKLTNANIGSKKAYSAKYQQFREEASFDENFLARMYGTRFATYFYSSDEITHFSKSFTKASILKSNN